MIYDGGRFLGTILADDPAPYRAARDAAIAASTPFDVWWEQHTEFWRDRHRAAAQ